MRTYEVLFVLSPQCTEEEATGLINDFRGIAESTGAKLVSEEPWGRRRLAYEVQKSHEGIYHLFVFESEGALSEVDRKMRNSDRVLRHIIVRTDLEMKRAVKLAAKRPPKKERVVPAAAPAEEATPVAPVPVPPEAEPASDTEVTA